MVKKGRYQVFFSAKNLPNGRWFRTCSPKLTVKITSGSQAGTVVGKTKPVPKNRNPDWEETFFLNFTEREVTNLEATVWDCSGNEPVWLGEANFEATAVYREQGKTQNCQIGKRTESILSCHIEKSKLGDAAGYFSFHLRGLDIKNVEPGPFGLGRSDPFYEISKKNADYRVGFVSWNVIYRSEVKKNNLNPYWKPIDFDLEKLCYGDLSWDLKITVFDHNDNGKHVRIGEYETTVKDLQDHIAIKGNADREQAIRIGEEEDHKIYGLLCVLQAKVVENQASGAV